MMHQKPDNYKAKVYNIILCCLKWSLPGQPDCTCSNMQKIFMEVINLAGSLGLSGWFTWSVLYQTAVTVAILLLGPRSDEIDEGISHVRHFH